MWRMRTQKASAKKKRVALLPNSYSLVKRSLKMPHIDQGSSVFLVEFLDYIIRDCNTLLCLIVGGGHFAIFEIFHPP